MCLVLVASRFHPRYPLVVAANRDEWRDRPAEPLHRWEDGILAGRDRRAGGTWLAVRPDGAFAATTNFRQPMPDTGARSRGELPLRVLRAGSLREGMAIDGSAYGGFHVIAGDRTTLWHVSNRDEPLEELSAGLHGISNGPRGTRWPKVAGGLEAMAAALKDEEPDVDALFALLADRTQPPDSELPDTGVGIEWERVLGPRRIDAGPYGTRVSTVVLVGDGVRVIERSWDPGGGTVDLTG